MHLLLAQKGTIDDGGEAVDLGQSPADVVVLSAADTEIAGLCLANLLRLKHPMSVDTYVERTLRHARLVVVRLLGGRAYWPYGLDALLASAQANGTKLCVLPGDDKPDPGLDPYQTIERADHDRLWHYLVEGGPENAMRFLRACRALLTGGEMPTGAERRRKPWHGAHQSPAPCRHCLLPRASSERSDRGDRLALRSHAQ